MRISFGLCLALLAGCGSSGSPRSELSLKGQPVARPFTSGTLTTSPSAPTVVEKHAVTFSIVGGDGAFAGYTCALDATASADATIVNHGDGTCTYTAGADPGATDLVDLADGSGDTGSFTASVVAPSLTDSSVTLVAGGAHTFAPRYEAATDGTWSNTTLATGSVDGNGGAWGRLATVRWSAICIVASFRHAATSRRTSAGAASSRSQPSPSGTMCCGACSTKAAICDTSEF